MKKTYLVLAGLMVLMFSAGYWLFAVPTVPAIRVSTSPEALARGEYLVKAGGCVSCHEGTTSPQSLSGGLALESPFGTFFVPNITPHPETGIGEWTGEDFLRAMKHGRSPDGDFYYPAFPYRSYAGMTDEDVLDIGAWLMSQPPVDASTPQAQTPVWLHRWMLAGWQALANLSAATPEIHNASDPQVQRGAYLARHLGHCGECHTPRNALGIMDMGREFLGGELVDGNVEAIDHGALADWTEDDVAFLLLLGMKPDGEYVGGEMEPVIEHNTSQLTEEDRRALAAFLKRGLSSGI